MTWNACWVFAQTAHKGDTFPMARTVLCRSEAASNKFGAAFHRTDFGVEIAEMIPGEENTIVVQALLGGTMPADVPGLVKKGEVGRIAHAYIIRYNTDGKISRLDCYWDNTSINAIKASAL
jgi:hypothetical protein